MSVVEISQRDRSGAAHIGHLVNEICRSVIDYDLPMMLQSKPERLDYCHHVARAMRERAWPTSAGARTAQGTATQKRILNALNKISLKSCSLLPITRAQAMRLSQLVLFCNRPQDWASPQGPVIGANSAKLAAYLGVNDVNEAMTPLLKLGLVSLWNPQGNGRRWFQILNQGCASETTCGSGWTLAPLLLLIDQIEDLLAQESLRLAQRERLTRETRGIIQRLRNEAATLADSGRETMLAKIDELALMFHNARKGRLSRLEAIHADAHRLLSDLGDLSALFYPSSGEEHAGVGVREYPPAIYTKNSFQNSRTGQQGQEICPKDGFRPQDERDRGGATSSRSLSEAGYLPHEAPALFPGLASLIDISRMPDTAHNLHLGRLSGISAHLVQRADLQMGSLEASVALMLVAEKLDRGEITRDPNAYLSGMIKKHSAHALNLGYSVSWLRKSKGNESGRGSRQEH